MRLMSSIALMVLTTAVGQKAITIDDFTTQDTFAQKTVSGINWTSDGKFYTSLRSNRIVRQSIDGTATEQVIFDGGAQSPAMRIASYSFSKDEQKLLVATNQESIYRRSSRADFYLFDVASKKLQMISRGGKQSYATFSPDGSRIAFARDNNLFLVDLSNMQESQITTDGALNSVINGSTDWVYEEELGFAQAFSWSPDGKRVAYYRFDESAVQQYTLQKWNDGALYPENYTYKYPKAGEANSSVEIWVHEVASGKKMKMSLGDERDIYIPRIDWTRNPLTLSIRRLNRLQNTMHLLQADVVSGQTSVAITDTNSKYFDIAYTGELIYLADGLHVIVSSEKSGNKHFYLYTVEGKLLRPLTSGEFEATTLVGVDEKANRLYYLSTEGSYLDRYLYSIGLDGKSKKKLSSTEGHRSINMSADCQFYLEYLSTANTPLVVTLFNTQTNKPVKVLEDNRELKSRLQEYGVASKSFFQYKSADGTTMLDGYIMRPQQQSGTRVPVMVYQYSGPRSNSVANTFGAGATLSWHQMLVQKGIAVAVVDTRGTGSRGESFTKQTYKQLGKMEAEDLAEASKYLRSLDYVDPARLGIWGWSYGGYTTSLVMTKGAGAYKLGIAGAPVTSWRYYDNIYTERFLQRPQDNPGGYDDNSPMTHAKSLTGELLIIHGTGDDNVHVQNSIAFIEALINAGKQFKSQLYPDQAHGFRGSEINKHRWTLMTDFVLDKL